MEFEHDALVLLVGQRLAIAALGSLPRQLRQIVGLELDAVELVVSAQLAYFGLGVLAAHHHLALLVARELVEKILFGIFLAILLFGAEVFGNLVHRHYRPRLYRIRLDLVDHLLRVGDGFGIVGKDGGHLVGRLEPFLLGVVHSVGVRHVFAGAQADEAVVGLAVLLLHKVDVVGGNQLGASAPRQLHKVRDDLLLALVDRGVGVGLVSHVTLEFDVIVVAEDALEPAHRLLGLVHPVADDELRQLAAETGRTDNQPLVILLELHLVDSRTAVETVDPRLGNQLAQILIALLVLGQQDKVPAAAVHNLLAAVLGVAHLDVLVLVVERAPRAVGLDAENRLEERALQTLDLGLGRSPDVVGGSLVGNYGLLLADGFLDARIDRIGTVEQFLDSEHVAVVSQRERIHPVADGMLDELVDFRHSVENRIVRMDVEVSKFSRRHERLLLCNQSAKIGLNS